MLEPSPSIALDRLSDQTWLRQRTRGRMARDCVLLHAPAQVFQAPGGGENQLVRTARELERLGVSTRPFVPWHDRLERASVLHLFGMSREGLELARVARARSVPVVLSTICWLDARAAWSLAPNSGRAILGVLGLTARRICSRCPSWRRELVHLADRLLPNSQAEAHQLIRYLGVRPEQITVVPNGFDERILDGDARRFRARHGDQPFVLFAGRLEPRKNLLRLIESARSEGLKLVVAGGEVPGWENYARSCRDAGGEQVTWLGRLDPGSGDLADAFSAARVFALPSWFETPGLAALEAAAAGCSIVITPRGCAREYFGDWARYASPGCQRSIRQALREAWRTPAPSELADRVQRCYSWAAIARQVQEVYDHVSRSA